MYSERLFSYGTLQLEEVQLATFKRKLKGAKDVLCGFYISEVKIIEPEVIKKSGKTTHPILLRSDNPKDEVFGTVFAVLPAELKQADEYEVDDYKRVQVQLKSGEKAWVYISVKS